MQIQWRWNVDKSIRDAVHHSQFKVGPSLVERFPSKVCDHLTGAAGGSIVPCHKSCRTPLDGFQLLDDVDAYSRIGRTRA